jgi:hypothetical protein
VSIGRGLRWESPASATASSGSTQPGRSNLHHEVRNEMARVLRSLALSGGAIPVCSSCAGDARSTRCDLPCLTLNTRRNPGDDVSHTAPGCSRRSHQEPDCSVRWWQFPYPGRGWVRVDRFMFSRSNREKRQHRVQVERHRRVGPLLPRPIAAFLRGRDHAFDTRFL